MLALVPVDSSLQNSRVNSKGKPFSKMRPQPIRRFHSTMTVAPVDEEQLRTLIEQARNPNLSPLERQRALNRLLMLVQRLPDILRSHHPDALFAYNKTWEWFCANLREFEERPPSLQRSLVVWINGYLSWRFKDLWSRSSRNSPDSLDRPIGGEDSRTLMDVVPDSTPSLSTLDGYIEAEQTHRQQQRSQWVEQYVEQDPEGQLASCHPRRYPTCNCQILAQRILLKEPPDKLSTLSEEFGVNYQTLTSHWKKKCLPLLREIANRYPNLS